MAAASLISYCPNWEITTHDNNNNNIILDFSETSDDAAPLFLPDQPHPMDTHHHHHHHQLEPSAAAAGLFLGGFDNDHDFLLLPESSTSFDALFNSSSGGDIFSAPPAEYSLLPQELELQAPKRQKLHHGGITQNAFGVFIPNPPLLGEFEPPPPLELPPFPAYGLEAERKSEGPAGKTLSPQSIAARERRRRITEKTHELGKLIPGGKKMNTAEMFQAAYNYIKFMQAQVSVLQSCMSQSQEKGEIIINEEMERLVGCSLIQEKLYSKDKCLVPENLILSLPNSHDLLESINPPN